MPQEAEHCRPHSLTLSLLVGFSQWRTPAEDWGEWGVGGKGMGHYCLPHCGLAEADSSLHGHSSYRWHSNQIPVTSPSPYLFPSRIVMAPCYCWTWGTSSSLSTVHLWEVSPFERDLSVYPGPSAPLPLVNISKQHSMTDSSPILSPDKQSHYS